MAVFYGDEMPPDVGVKSFMRKIYDEPSHSKSRDEDMTSLAFGAR
jgi:hypothetical protein